MKNAIEIKSIDEVLTPFDRFEFENIIIQTCCAVYDRLLIELHVV